MSSFWKVLRFVNTYYNEEVMTVLEHKGHVARESDFQNEFSFEVA